MWPKAFVVFIETNWNRWAFLGRLVFWIRHSFGLTIFSPIDRFWAFTLADNLLILCQTDTARQTSWDALTNYRTKKHLHTLKGPQWTNRQETVCVRLLHAIFSQQLCSWQLAASQEMFPHALASQGSWRCQKMERGRCGSLVLRYWLWSPEPLNGHSWTLGLSGFTPSWWRERLANPQTTIRFRC